MQQAAACGLLRASLKFNMQGKFESKKQHI
jgi:hypothetical protein